MIPAGKNRWESRGIYRPDSGQRGFSLLEIVIIVAIIVILATAGIAQYLSAVNTAKITKACGDIKTISTSMMIYKTQHGAYPVSLDAVNYGFRPDPWGRYYQYLKLEDEASTKKGKPMVGKPRKDKNLVPINTDYDLYSVGPDGDSIPPLTAKQSWDDIIRANNGDYIGLAKSY